LINEAIDTVKRSIQWFESDSSAYGLALAHFQAGYLLETYLDELTGGVITGAHDDYITRAKDHFEEASKHFTQLNHLSGMYLSKKHIQSVFDVMNKG